MIERKNEPPTYMKSAPTFTTCLSNTGGWPGRILIKIIRHSAFRNSLRRPSEELRKSRLAVMTVVKDSSLPVVSKQSVNVSGGEERWETRERNSRSEVLDFFWTGVNSNKDADVEVD